MRALLRGIVTAWFVASSAFFCLRLAPGDPIERILGPQAKAHQIDEYRERLGLNLPMHTQYIAFLGGLITLDWGQSLFSSRDVLEIIGEGIVPTLKLAFIAMCLSFFIGSFFGVWSALYKGQKTDHILRFATLLAIAFPIFSLGPILIIIFAIKLKWLPVSELTSVKHYVLPVLSLTLPLSSVLSRVVRNQYLELSHEPWITVLKAKGLSRFAIILRIYKVCLPTILNVVSLQLSVILAGAMITETIFDIPGLGRLLLTGIENRDYPVVQGLIIYSALIYLLLYLITDLINEKIDPRLGIQ